MFSNDQEEFREVPSKWPPCIRLAGMAPFIPLDGELQWDLLRGLEASKCYSGVFGTASPYEAYLFVGLLKRLGADHILGAGCSEKEVEDLVDSAADPVLLFLVEGIARDCGVGLVKRLKARRPDLKAMLLVNSVETYARTTGILDAFDGVAAGGSVGRGGLLKCLETLVSGRRYLDSTLKDVHQSGVRSAWNELNQREREILPLLAKGMKNKQIANELFIAETTTRDYVSSILSKLQVSNRAAAAAWAIEHGFIGA